ncbi:MurR/RpiR family transcriptional regulator [Desulfitobacterium sp. Sab5]|uniref:MurR/RpiR family transcriptional regulator n=1 Tax=Desulfitobacterium nosdiversum TaxID=3375356 RepID=UPI003CF17FEC
MVHSRLQGCLPRLRGILPSLTSAEGRVANYILENSQQIIHLSITELAELAQCAEATIFRLCKRLGYGGYQAFKISLASELVEPLANIHQEITQKDSLSTIAAKVFHSNIEALQDTLKLIHEESLEKAVKALHEAERIEFYGLGGSAPVAMDAYHKFVRVGIPCIALTDPHLQVISARLLSPKGVAFGISHSGSNKDIVESLKAAREAGALTICLTNYPKAPVTKVSDICLISSSRESHFRSEAMSSRIAQLSIIDTLFVGVSLLRQDMVLDNLQKIREVISRKRF